MPWRKLREAFWMLCTLLEAFICLRMRLTPQIFYGGGGGTWERIKDRFLLASGDTYTAGITGGEATHTLTASEIPDLGTFVALNWYNQAQYTTGIFKNGGMKTQDRTAPTGTEMGENYIKASGGGESHNNMPPYLTVYVWQRMA